MGIHALPSNTIRAIGASQVLNDSATVVKELIDNALDAGATVIAVEVSANILDVIQVRDNGHGIPQVDRNLLGRRHCTSKIRDVHELACLGGSSLGFRGEGLASIAELSGGFSITTRVNADQTAMTMIFDRRGKMTGTIRASLPIGTVVKVTDFLQTSPVRRRIAGKSNHTIMQRIRHIMQAYAFARPSVRLSLKVLKHTGQCDFFYSPASVPTIVDATMKLFSVRCSSQCISATAEDDGLSMRAFLPRQDADLSKVAGLGGYITCDGRPVSILKGTFKQIYKIFRSTLQNAAGSNHIAKDVFFALTIDCAAGSYDVNVEPAKDDVIFQDPESVLRVARLLLSNAYIEANRTQPSRVDFNNQLLTPFQSSDAAEPELPPNSSKLFPNSAAGRIGIKSPQAHGDAVLLRRGTMNMESGAKQVESVPNSSADFTNDTDQTNIVSYLAKPASPITLEQTGAANTRTLDSSQPAVHNASTHRTMLGHIAPVSTPGTQTARYDTAKSLRGTTRGPFVPPTHQMPARERVWFDHLEPYERGERIVTRQQHRSSRRNRRQDNLGGFTDDPRPLTPPQRNKDIRSFWSRPAAHTQLNPACSKSVIIQSTGTQATSQRSYQSPSRVPPAAAQETEQLTSMVPPIEPCGLGEPPSSAHKQRGDWISTCLTSARREASAQVLTFAMLSAATRILTVLTTSLSDMNLSARMMNHMRTFPGWDEDIATACLSMEQILDPIETERMTSKVRCLLSRHNISQYATKTAVQSACKSDAMTDDEWGSDTELLIAD